MINFALFVHFLYHSLIFLFKPIHPWFPAGYMPRGEGEMYGKSDMETCITICKIDSQWEFAVWLRKLKQWLGINLEGWMGREVQKGGNICIPMANAC